MFPPMALLPLALGLPQGHFTSGLVQNRILLGPLPQYPALLLLTRGLDWHRIPLAHLPLDLGFLQLVWHHCPIPLDPIVLTRTPIALFLDWQLGPLPLGLV